MHGVDCKPSCAVRQSRRGTRRKLRVREGRLRAGGIMQVFHDPGHGAHESQSELNQGRLVRSFECPERMAYILTALSEAGFPAPVTPPPVPLHRIESVHTPAFVRFLETAHDRWVAAHGDSEAIAFTYPVPGLRRTEPPLEIDGALGHYNFSVDTCITAGTWQAALGAAACAHSAALAVSAGANAAFALARPPGHHAHADLYGGYCYLNNAALAAETLRAGGAARVAVLDIDYHHGNGTQAIFYDRDDVLFLSLHADPRQEFPYFLGHADEHGTGAGRGHTVNYPMPWGTEFPLWSEALEQACARIAAHGSDVVVVSLGVDTFVDDPISRFRLVTPDFTTIGARLARMGLPLVFVMEGGYAVEAIGHNVAGVLGGFAGA
jgi:acetoin utilization deacetylase AcuC-like enzyme